MTNTSPRASVALLIDADNAQLKCTEQVLKIAQQYGRLKISRAYGDWKMQNLSSWLEKIVALNIDCIQVDRIGKNATDHRLLMDAVEILHTHVDDDAVRTFIIVSGDGDFVSACKFLQERGKQVIGIGSEATTAESLRKAYNKFYPMSDSKQEFGKLEKPVPVVHPNPDSIGFNLLKKAYMQVRESNGRANLAQLGSALLKLDPDYKSRFSVKNPSTLLRAYPGKFKVDGDYVSLVS